MVEALRLADHDVVARLPGLLGIDQWISKYCGSRRRKIFGPSLPCAQQARFSSTSGRLRVLVSGARLGEARQVLQRGLRRVDQLDLAARARSSASRGVIQTSCTSRWRRSSRAGPRREREEEARVEAPRAPGAVIQWPK